MNAPSDNNSYITGVTDSSLLQENEVFRNVDITVAVLGLTHGIMMETSKNEDRRINRGEENLLGDSPVLAVVSGVKEASSEQMHLPSMPLQNANLSVNSKPRRYEFMALWPANEENKRSTLTFTRRIKRTCVNETYSYSNEKLILAVSLMKGYEIITLGQVSIPFTFSEENIHVQLPVRTTISHVEYAASKMKGLKFRKNKMKRRSKMNNLVKPLAFHDDPSRIFSFHEDSMLNVLIQTLTIDESVCSNESFTTQPMSMGESATCSLSDTMQIDEDLKMHDLGPAGCDDSSQGRSLTAGEFIDIKRKVDILGKSSSSDLFNGIVNTNSTGEISQLKGSQDDSYVANGEPDNRMIQQLNNLPKLPNQGKLLSQKLNGCTIELNSPLVVRRQNEQTNDNFFPTVSVTSHSTDSLNTSFEMVDDFGFTGSGAETSTKDDGTTTSSWTYTSWM